MVVSGGTSFPWICHARLVLTGFLESHSFLLSQPLLELVLVSFSSALILLTQGSSRLALCNRISLCLSVSVGTHPLYGSCVCACIFHQLTEDSSVQG